MKNLIKSRRGIAIEMAIGAMLIMMALSIVLISISGMQHKHAQDDRGDFVKKIEAYEITDYILKNHTAGERVEAIDGSDEYTVVCEKLDNGNYAYTISKTGSVILTLEINTVTTVTDDNVTITKNTIISWRD